MTKFSGQEEGRKVCGNLVRRKEERLAKIWSGGREEGLRKFSGQEEGRKVCAGKGNQNN